MGKIGPWRILRFFLSKLIFQGFSTKNWKIVQFHHEKLFVGIVSDRKHLFHMKVEDSSILKM
jgi:hypothetical protein